MKKVLYFIMAITIAGVQLAACKNKSQDNSTTNTDTAAQTPAPAPVEISSDDSLTTGLKDATKDFPGVTATVNNGEVTLTGTIQRDRLTKLMQSVQALHPKKVNNNLTIQ